jgi:drug/metabolite transporter (DMT)-like permease
VSESTPTPLELEKTLELWLKFRSASEQRNYWFLLAQTAMLGLVVTNLGDILNSNHPRWYALAFAVVGFASAMIATAALVASRWDSPRLRRITDRIPADMRAHFQVDWDARALFGAYLFGAFYFAVGGAIARKPGATNLDVLAVVAIAALTCGVVAAFIGMERFRPE